MLRVAYIIAGLFLMGQAVYVTVLLVHRSSVLVLAALSPALLAALALGALLVIKNVRGPREPEQPEDPTG